MTLTAQETAEALNMLHRLYPKAEFTDELNRQYALVLVGSLTFDAAFTALELYVQENDQAFCTVAGMRDRIERVNARSAIENTDPMLDGPPGIDFADWLREQPSDVQERVARIAPAVGAKFGIKLAADPELDERQRAIERARAMKRGGWS